MRSCRETARRLSAQQFQQVPFWQRMALVAHLAMCRHCRAFAKQISRLQKLARLASARAASEPPDDFEAAILSRLRR